MAGTANDGTLSASAEKKKLNPLGKTDPAEAAKRRLQIHIFLIFCSGLVTFVLITVGVASAPVMAFGPFTPSFIQEALDFIKGLS